MGIATVSTILIEEPIRGSRFPILVRRRGIATALTAMAIVGLCVTTLTGPVTRVAGGGTTLASALSVVRTDRERLIADKCYSTLNSDAKLHDCIYGIGAAADGRPAHGTPAGAPIVVLFGDSHAMHWFPVVNAWATDAGVDLVPLVRSGCAAIDAIPVGTGARQDACRAWLRAALAKIGDLHPILTIVSSSTGIPFIQERIVVQARVTPDAWRAALTPMLEQIRQGSPSVLLIGDVPRPGFSAPDCLAVHRADPLACERTLADSSPPALIAAEAAAATAAGVAFVDPGPWLCPSDVCTWMVGNRIGWVDDHHISATNALAQRAHLQPVFDSAAGR
jgi:hypothetical protein